MKRNLKTYLYYIIAEFCNLFITPQKDFWLISSSFNTEFNYNSKPIFEYLLKNNSEINCKYVINDKRKREKLTRIYGDHFTETKTLKGIIGALRAGVWLTSAGLPIYLMFSRKNRLIFNLWHGTPLKKIGLGDSNYSWFGKQLVKIFHFRNYSFVSVSSSKLVPVFAESFCLPKQKVKVLGQPRNDKLSTKSIRKNWLSDKYTDLPSYKKTVLYAPTFREYGGVEIFPFSDFEEEKLIDFLEKEDIILFIRMHISEKSKLKFKPEGRIQLMNKNKVDEINDVLPFFDMLITDYSSIYIDYLITEKPVLFLPYDLNSFMTESRGFNFNYDSFTPGPKPQNMKKFLLETQTLLNNKNYYKKERKNINQFFNEVKIGSSKKIIDFIKSAQRR